VAENNCKAEHIAVGSEILLGQIQNGHAQNISRILADKGFFLYYHSAVGDNLDRILQVYRTASSRSNVVIVTGGLGPTEDDLTKEALATFLGRRLVLSQESLERLEDFFTRRGRVMPPANRKQAMCIDGGELLDNPNGTAPGQYVVDKGVYYFLLPGPPLEMTPMLKNHVLPRLQQVFPPKHLESRILHLCGIGESDVDARIVDLTQKSNPTVAPLAGEGEMLLRLTATDTAERSARELIGETEDLLRQRFSRYIYGVDDETLPVVIGNKLRHLSASLSFAESCTGGLLSSMITQVSGSSDYFLGSVVSYSNDAKRTVLGVDADILEGYGAVSAETARLMAEGVRRLMGTTYGVSVTGIAGPSGGSAEKPVGLVYGAVSSAENTVPFKMMHSGSRRQIQIRAATRVLWELWRVLGR